MRTIEQFLVVHPTSSLSADDLRIDQLYSSSDRSDMSLSRIRERLQDFRAGTKRQARLSKERLASIHFQNDNTQLSRTASASNDGPRRSDTIVGFQNTSPDNPLRKRDRIQQWLAHQKQRLERFKEDARRHRDSMFDKEDIEKELNRASQGANSIVIGPEGQPIDQRVIDHFFELNESGASGWRDSALWERHAAKCLRMQCEVCQSTRYKTSSTPAPWQMPSSPLASPDTPKATRSPRKSISSKEDNTPIRRWRLISRRRKFKRGKSHDKGKSKATDEELMHIFGSLSTSQTQLAEHQHEPKRPRGNIFIRNSIQRTQSRPVFCTFVSKRLDPAQIPVPAVPDLKPADSSALDLTNPYHFTGRPYSPCPLEEGRLPFPLCGGRLPPPTPELKPEQLVESVPELLQLTGPVRECPEGAVFPMSPLNSLNPGTFTLPGGHRQTIRLVAPSPEKLFTTYRPDELSMREAESPKSPRTPAAVAVATAAATTTTTTMRTVAAANPQHNPTPAAAFPPTPPDSRQNSETFPSGFTYTSYGLKIAASGAKPMPDGPADRDWAACTLSDTTASSSPDCRLYVDQRAVSTQRRGLGMGVFR